MLTIQPRMTRTRLHDTTVKLQNTGQAFRARHDSFLLNKTKLWDIFTSFGGGVSKRSQAGDVNEILTVLCMGSSRLLRRRRKSVHRKVVLLIADSHPQNKTHAKLLHVSLSCHLPCACVVLEESHLVCHLRQNLLEP